MGDRLRRTLAAHFPVIVLAAGLLLALAALAWLASAMWFVSDDFAFLLRYSVLGNTPGGVHNALQPHNQHWMTVPVLIFRALFAVVGMRSYLPYGMLPILAHAVVVGATYRLMRRTGVEAWPAALTGIVLGWYGGAAEDLLWDFQIGFVGSAAFLVTAALVVAEKSSWRRRLGAALLAIGGLMCSGMAVPLVVWMGVFVLMRHGWRVAAWVTAPPAVVFVVWRLTAGRDQPPSPRIGVESTLLGLVRGLGAAWHLAAGMPVPAGVLLWAALMLGSAVLPAARPSRALAVSGMVGTLVTMLVVALGRAGLSSTSTESSRYAYFEVLLSVPTLALLVAVLLRRRALAAMAVAGVMWFVVVGAWRLHRFADDRAPLFAGTSQRIVAAARLVGDDAPLLSASIDPSLNPDIVASRLGDPYVRARLPHVTPMPSASEAVVADLQVGVATTPFPVPAGAADVQNVDDVTRVGSCLSGTAGPHSRVVVAPGAAGGQVRVQLAGSSVKTSLSFSEGSTKPVRWAFPIGTNTLYAATVADVPMVVHVPPGPIDVCWSVQAAPPV